MTEGPEGFSALTLEASAQAAPDPPPPPVVVWYLADIVTGSVLTELPLDPGGTVKKLIAKVEQNQFTLPVLDDKTPDDWANLLVDGKTMIVLTLDAVPTQAWAVLGHVVGEVLVPITASTLEECLQRTYVPDIDETALDDALAGALLVAPVATNFGFTVDAEACGKVSDHLYETVEDRKVLDALNDLMKADGGPEWRITVAWEDESTKRAFTKTIEIKARIGIDRPDAVFDLDAGGRGVVESYSRTSSYADGKGATSLIATSEGSGLSRPMTDPVVSDLVATGWPLWESRVNFPGLDAASVGDEDTELANLALATLRRREQGTTTWTVSGSQWAPRPGVDYAEGDVVIIAIAPQGKRDPIGGVTPARVQGWELDTVSWRGTPQLWDDGSESDG